MHEKRQERKGKRNLRGEYMRLKEIPGNGKGREEKVRREDTKIYVKEKKAERRGNESK